MSALLLRTAAVGDLIDASGSASGSGASGSFEVRRTYEGVFCGCYSILALWCLRVLVRQYQSLEPKPTTSPRTSVLFSSPRAAIASPRDTGGSWRVVSSVSHQPHWDDSVGPTSRSYRLFHALLLVFTLARAVIWGFGVRVANGSLRLTILIPSLLYLSSLFVLLSIWCKVRDELVSKFAGSSGSGSVADTLRWPLTLACAAMWLGLVAVSVVEVYTGQMWKEDSAGTHLVVWYLGSVYGLVSVLFVVVGTLLVRWLGEVADLLSLTAKERVDLARYRVFVVTICVGPLSALRSGMTLIQLFSFAREVTQNQWYPIGYYVATELLPLVVMLSQIKPNPPQHKVPPKEPDSRRASAISAEPSPPEAQPFILSTPRAIGRTEFSPPLAAVRASVKSFASPRLEVETGRGSRPAVAESSGPLISPRDADFASPHRTPLPSVLQRGSFRGPLSGVLASSAAVRLTASPPPPPAAIPC